MSSPSVRMANYQSGPLVWGSNVGTRTQLTPRRWVRLGPPCRANLFTLLVPGPDEESMLKHSVDSGCRALEVRRSNSLNAPRVRWTLESLFQKLGVRWPPTTPASNVRFFLFADGGSSGESFDRGSLEYRRRFFDGGLSWTAHMVREMGRLRKRVRKKSAAMAGGRGRVSTADRVPGGALKHPSIGRCPSIQRPEVSCGGSGCKHDWIRGARYQAAKSSGVCRNSHRGSKPGSIGEEG